MENIQYDEASDSATSFCLGHPPHPLSGEEMICRICGTLASGAMIGIYRVQRLLGTGRSGQAYLAVHQRSGQPVVVKLFPHNATNIHLWEAARREVRVVTTLHHGSILPVFSCTTWYTEPHNRILRQTQDLHMTPYGHETYLLTLCQYIPGTLNNLIAHCRKPEAQKAFNDRGLTSLSVLINLIKQAGSALGTAHTRGITHGALVPGNILLTNVDRLWIADFGLARLHPPAPPYLPPELYNVSAASTHAGDMRTYWNAVNPESDQYMFAMVCQQLLSQILPQSEYTYLQPVLQRATQQRPERRYPSIDLFVHDLVTLATNRTPLYATVGSNSSYEQQYGRNAERSTSGSFAGPLTPSRPYAPLNEQLATSITPVIPFTPFTPPTPGVAATPLTPSSALQLEDWEKQGDKLFTQHDYESALKAYHRALEANAGKAHIWLALGDTYFAMERYKEALMGYEQAMYLNPNDAQVWSNRGTALDALGRHQEALDCYERAEQLQ